MNANELANELADYLEVSPNMTVFKAAAVLRQQAKELDEAGGMIGVLREYISDLEKGLDSSIKLNKAQAKRNAEPVAWMYRIKDTDNRWELTWNKPTTGELFDTEPLYAHPVKELTDEEIYDVFEGCLFKGGFNTYEFARAILRKAQEK